MQLILIVVVFALMAMASGQYLARPSYGYGYAAASPVYGVRPAGVRPSYAVRYGPLYGGLGIRHY